MAVFPGGGFVVAWTSSGQDGSGTGVYAQRFDAASERQGGEFRVNAVTTGNQQAPSIAGNANGNFDITWNDYHGTTTGDVYARQFDASGNALGNEFRVNSYTTEEQWASAVAMNDRGDFVITWHSRFQDGSSFGIYAQRYDAAGLPQGGEFRVNTTTISEQSNPAVGMDDSGNFVITWIGANQDGSSYGIVARRYDNQGNPRGGEFQVNSYTPDAQRYTAVAMDGSGAFVITWSSQGQDGSGSGVYGQSFDPDGTPVGPEFPVNTTTEGNQENPSVARNRAGNFIIVWSGNGPGDEQGIFGQRFTTSTPVDITIESARPIDTTSVEFTYRVAGNPGSFQAGLYQSADDRFDPSDTPVGVFQTVVPLAGAESVGTLTLSGPLPVDAHKPFYLLVADPEDAIAETDESNNTASFLLPDIVLTQVAAENHGKSVVLDYEVRDAAVPSFQLALYRSADTQVDDGDQQIITVTVNDGSVGVHHLCVALPSPLAIDPAHPVVLAKADPNSLIAETGRTNDIAYFHKYVVGVVTHGFELFGQPPDWIYSMAGSLFGIGYSFAIPFDWAAASRVPLPGMATQAGENLADLVVSRVENFLTTQGVQPNDSIDLHFIGHSRGAVVISSALQVLEETEQAGELLPQLAGGYVKMTMLDPHPAHNHLLPLFSSMASDILLPEVVTAFGWLAATGVIAFQAAAQDPEVVVPANVNEAEVYFQHTNSLALLFTNWEEAILNLWGEVPVVGTDHCYNLTGPGIGHGEVPDWYQQHVIPTLGLAPVAPLTAATRMLPSVQGGMSAAAANAPAMESTPSARGEHLSEDFLFPAAVDTPGILHSLGSKLAAAQTAALQGNIRAEENILQAFLHELSAQRARHITIVAADFLAALTQLAIEGIHQSGLASSAQSSRSDSPGVSGDTPTALAQKWFLAPARTPPANLGSDNSGPQLQTGRPDEESLVPIEVGLFAGDLLPVRERPAPGNRR